MRPEETIYGLRGVGFVEYARLAGGIAVIAVHGGGIEPGTEELAHYVADKTGCSLYVFSGRLARGNTRLRRMSKSLYIQEGSLRKRVLDQAEAVLSIHGHGREVPEVYAGGTSDRLKDIFMEMMAERLPGFPVVTDPERIPEGLKGIHPRNVVNVPPGGGLQLELPKKLRTCTHAALGEREITGEAVILGEVLVEVVRAQM